MTLKAEIKKHKTLVGYLIIFAVLLIASAVILHHRPLLNAAKKDLFDHYGTNIVVTSYDQQGHIKSVLTAVKAIHYKASGETHLTSPRLKTFQGQAKLPWHIKSDYAVVNQAGTKALLTGHVLLHQLPIPGHPEVRIKTTTLTAYLKQSYATTKAPVTILRQGTIIHGIGMTANLKTGVYHLLSHSSADIDLQNQPKK